MINPGAHLFDFLSRMDRLAQIRKRSVKRYYLPGQHDQEAHGNREGGEAKRDSVTRTPIQKSLPTLKPEEITNADGNGVIVSSYGIKYPILFDAKNRSYSIGIPGKEHLQARGVTVGGATLTNDGKSVMSVGIQKEFQRLGLASALYRHIERHIGHTLEPNWALTKEGAAFWENRKYAYAQANGNGYQLALMGFDFTDLPLRRRMFQAYLEHQGVEPKIAEAEANRLEHSWEFAASDHGKSFFQSLPHWRGALDLTAGSTGLKLFEQYKRVRGYAGWDESKHPRGKSSPESTPGSFTGGERVSENLPSDTEFRNKLFNAKKESGMAFDKDGKPIVIIKGKEDRIIIHDEEVKAMNNGRWMHNHPGGSMLSPPDLVLAERANLASIEAFGIDKFTGERIKWIAERPIKGWPDERSVKSMQRTLTMVHVSQAKTKVRSKEMTVDQAAHWAANLISEGVAKHFGIEIKKHVDS